MHEISTKRLAAVQYDPNDYRLPLEASHDAAEDEDKLGKE